ELYPADTDPRFDVLTREETERFLDSPDFGNRFAAVSVISENAVPKRLWDRLLQMAREDPDAPVRGACWEALMDGWERADVRKAMWACADDESASEEERAGALLSLAGREGESEELHHRLLKLYARESFRPRAMRAMAVTQSARFQEYFRKHLDDPDREM